MSGKGCTMEWAKQRLALMLLVTIEVTQGVTEQRRPERGGIGPA